jgi:uncharacterized RDD family membrane protein YckC
MKKIKITTPENIEVEYTLADLGSRGAAALIDMLVQGVFAILIGIAILLILYFSPQLWDQYYGWIIGISLILYTLIIYGYFIIMELNMGGMTLGKKVLKLRTIRSNGQPLTLKHSALRNLFRIILDMAGIGVVLIFFTKHKKRLGDMVASTIVISEQNKSRPITLEDLQRTKEHFNYYISPEESELLRDYLARKNSMEDYSYLSKQLRAHFTKKFSDLGVLGEWEEFINSL